MNEIAVVEDSKDFLKKIVYNIRYGRKFKKFNIDKSFSDTLISRSKDSDEIEIFHLITPPERPSLRPYRPRAICSEKPFLFPRLQDVF